MESLGSSWMNSSQFKGGGSTSPAVLPDSQDQEANMSRSASIIDLTEESPVKSPHAKKSRGNGSSSGAPVGRNLTDSMSGVVAPLSPKIENIEEWDDYEAQSTATPKILLNDGVALLSQHAVTDFAEVIRICEEETRDHRKVCKVRPLICPEGCREATFLIDLQSVNCADLNHDNYGVWGNHPGFKKKYFRFDPVSKKSSIASEKSHQWKIQKLHWNHPCSVQNGQFKFHRYIYQATHFGETKPRWGVISYRWDCEPFKFNPKSHGNSRKRPDESFFSTDKAVLENLKTERKKTAPEAAYHTVKNSIGGAADVRSSSELPRGRGQVYNLAKQIDVPKGKEGIACEPGYQAAQRLCTDTEFKFARQFSSGVDPVPRVDPKTKETKMVECFRAFLASDDQIQLFYEACIKRGHYMQVDGTFDVVSGGYLTTISIRHPAVINVRVGKESLEPVAFMLSSSKTPRDYAWFAQQLEAELRPKMTPKDSNHISVWVSDGEAALLEGFQLCSLFDKKFSGHILCELHLKENDKEQLKGRGFGDSQIHSILMDIYGSESSHPDIPGRRRVQGLVDLSGKEYDDHYWVLKHKWTKIIPNGEKRGRNREVNSGWCEWFEKNRFDKLKVHYSPDVRLRMSKGPLAGRVTNNEAENMNRRIQCATVGITHRKLAWDGAIMKLHAWIQSRTLDMKDCIIRAGDFRLTEEFRHLEISPDIWQGLSSAQKSGLSEKLFLTPCTDSFLQTESLDKCPHPAVPYGIWKTILQQANQISERSDLIRQLDGDDTDVFSVVFGSKHHIVQKGNGMYRCDCQSFHLHGSLCCHSIAVATIHGERDLMFADLRAKFNKKATVTVPKVNSLLKDSGSKPNARKRNRGVPAPPVIVQSLPGRNMGFHTASLSNDGPTQAMKFQISVPRPAEYTMPFHNDEPFVLTLLKDYWGSGKQAKECKHCEVEFSKVNFKPPADLVITHLEVFQFPPPGNQHHTTREQWLWSKQKRIHLLHASFKCVFGRYGSYFHTGCLRISEETLNKLTIEHRGKIMDQFGIDVQNIAKI